MRTRHRLLPGVVLLVALLSARSTSASPELGGELRMQMNAGGDTLATVTYTDGSKSALKLGTYFTAALGGSITPFRAGAHAFDIQGLVGWSTWSTGPENTDDRLALSRFPLELLGCYRWRLPVSGPWEVRVAGGASYQLIGSASGTGSLDNISVDVDNALGWVADVGVVWGIVGMGVRYTNMRLQVGSSTFDGSSIGATLGLVFPPVREAPAPPAANSIAGG